MLNLLNWLIEQPVVRAFITELVLRAFSDILFKSDADPEFRAKFLDLSRQLAGAQTVQEKQNVLKQIQALRESPLPHAQ